MRFSGGWPPIGRDHFEREARDGALFVGSPETVAAKIVRTVKALGLSRFDLKYANGKASGTAEYVLGAHPSGVLLLPASDGEFLLVDATADGVTVEPLTPTDFSRPLARVVLTDAPAEALPVSRRRVEDLAATVNVRC